VQLPARPETQRSSQKRHLTVARVGTSSCRMLSVVPVAILIHSGVPVRMPGTLASEQVREAAGHGKSVLERCFGKTFRAATCL